jgi:hypothetical protein
LVTTFTNVFALTAVGLVTPGNPAGSARGWPPSVCWAGLLRFRL